MTAGFDPASLGTSFLEEATQMIRQAHTYLAGAVSGTAMVAAAVVAFVLLVSFQALKDWPLAGISLGGDDSSATVPSNPAAGSAGPGAGTGAAGAAAGPGATAGSARGGDGRAAGAQGDRAAVDASPTAATGSPTAEAPPSGPSDQGASAPSGSSSPTGSASASPAGGGGGGGGANPGAGSSAGSSGQSTSGAVTETVNKTVSGADEATGGVIGSTGVTKVTEEAVNNVAGPESTVGNTVDEVVKGVGGLLGAGK